MKKLTALLLAVLMICLCSTAFAAEATYDSTKAFCRYLDSKDFTYTVRGIQGEKEYEVVDIPYTFSDSGYRITCKAFFYKNGVEVGFRVWNLIDFNQYFVNSMYKVCNDLNSAYRFARFYVDESDYSITCATDVDLLTNDIGRLAYEGMMNVINVARYGYEETLINYAK